MVFYRDVGVKTAAFSLQVAHSWWFLHQRDECKVFLEDWLAPVAVARFSSVSNLSFLSAWKYGECSTQWNSWSRSWSWNIKHSRVPSSACFLWLSLSDRFLHHCITASHLFQWLTWCMSHKSQMPQKTVYLKWWATHHQSPRQKT